jgi:YHS domain-containing protein
MKLAKAVAIAFLAAGMVTSVAWYGIAGEQTDKSAASAMVQTESRAYLHSYNVPSSGLALEGYCPVAYFAVDKAIQGSPEFASTHNDIVYHFVSAEAKAAFDANPEKFLPAFGGWCALGMAVEDKFPVDPRLFKIVDGKLLLFLRNRNVDALQLWNDGDEKALLKKAEASWAAAQK